MATDLTLHNKAEIITKLISIADKAGDAVMNIYKKDPTTSKKEDGSPVTNADIASHNIIISKLRENWPEIYILSEENKNKDNTKLDAQEYWAIDPLDGTKEFINKNNQFTINIALIRNGQPIIGLIFAPALDLLYIGSIIENGECRRRSNGKWIDLKNVGIKTLAKKNLRILVSRSHPSNELATWLDSLNTNHVKIEMGSSLKFCILAEGKADYYPRFGNTYIWDTAAGEVILESSGGSITTLENEKLNYRGKLINDFFIAKSASQAFFK